MSFPFARQYAPPPGPTEELIHASASRIIRCPGATIHFAAFDPYTATGDVIGASAFQKLSLNEELCRPKRIVIEAAPDGRCTWRFVPNARRERGVNNEGFWPRIVLFCGHPLTLTQEQWDFFKLDRGLECLVLSPPQLSTISIRSEDPPTPTPSKPPVFNVGPAPPVTPTPKGHAPASMLQRPPSGSGSETGRKKRRTYVEDHFSSDDEIVEGDDEADEEEVSDMVIDEEPGSSHRQARARLRKVRANREEARRKCREIIDKRRERTGQAVDDEDDMMSWSECPEPASSPAPPRATSSPFAKRKVDYLSDEGGGASDSSDDQKPRRKNYEKVGPAKRTRTTSPFVARAQLEMKRQKRVAARKEKLDKQTRARSAALQASLLRAMYEEARVELAQAAAATGSGTGTEPSSPRAEHSETSAEPSTPLAQNQFYSSGNEQAQSSQETLVDEDDEVRRRAAIEESRRKLAELEKDKPLWQEHARKRATQEAEEKARAEAKRKARAAEEEAATKQAKAAKDAPTRNTKSQDNPRRRTDEEEVRARDAAKAELHGKRKRIREAAVREAHSYLAAKPWDKWTALERYMKLSESFDKLNFSKGDVIVFETIPWPIMSPPGRFQVEDIDWMAVESFFLQIRTCLSQEEYKAVVVTSHRRFHPDRWNSRKVLQCVDDEYEKECLDSAAKTVAQALTPIWESVTGRS